MGENNKVQEYDYIFLFPGKNFSINFVNSWTNTVLYMYEKGYTFASSFKYAPIIQEVRNQLLSARVLVRKDGRTTITGGRSVSKSPFANTAKAKKVIFIDSDMVWGVEDLEKILNTDKDVMCGPYFLESGQDMCIIDSDGVFMDMKKIKEKTEPFEILSGGMGFVSVNFEVLEKIGFPWFNTLYLDDESGGTQFVGEDTFFFYRVNEEGFKVYCDPTIRIGHEKPRVLTILDYDQAE